MRLLLALGVPLALSTSLLAQQTLVVQGGGDALLDAVAQASSGDVLVVRAGSYNGVLIDKGLNVRCDPGVLVVPVGRNSALTVDVPAGQLLQWSGGSLQGNPLFPSLFAGGAGVVLFTDFAAGTMAQIHGRQVGFQRCGFGQVSVGGLYPNTSAAFSGCNLTGGCTIDDARVTVAGGTITGLTSVFGGRPAVVMRGPVELILTGAAGTVVAAGAGGVAPAIEAAGGTVVVAPTVQLMSGGPQVVTGAAQVIFRHLPAVESVTAAAGQSFMATVYGEVGSSTHLLLNLPGAPIRLPFGTLWVGQGSLLLDSGIVPASGMRGVTVPLPANLPRHLPVVLQSITTLTSGGLWIGPPTVEILN